MFRAVGAFAQQPECLGALGSLIVPDLWQQQAVTALRAGKDVVVQAPTGAGKTLIFELWSNFGKPRGRAIYTVPTRALANDKLAEWRARGWNVGIATGDLAENLDAPIVVATLETQKNRLIRGEGPDLLVIDEYQMLSDPERGLNYEVAIALAPAHTQLLLLSGSVANPQDVVKWLRRLGRDAVLVRHDERPVPLEEIHANSLSYHVPDEIRGYWPRLVARALAEDLGPILIFAPRRQAAEAMATELARQLPNPNPLQLSPAQKALVGRHLAELLRCRIAYHHSGLSYGARAGVIEPLAKAGQLRVVVATMGLAAGINFSLRSVALAGESYRRDEIEQPLRPDEVLQMFGRAGRRGLDETGYVIVTANGIRLLDARPAYLARNGLVDWGALLGLMKAAVEQGEEPFAAAVRAQERLFTSKPIVLGIEQSLKNPNAPCGLRTDSERARHVRKRIRQMLNSRGEWENYPNPVEKPVRDVFVLVRQNPGPTRGSTSAGTSPADAPGMHAQMIELVPALAVPDALEKVGSGTLCIIAEDERGRKIYGRAVTVAEKLSDGRVSIAKWVRRLTNWRGRLAPAKLWDQRIAPLLAEKLAKQKTPVTGYVQNGHRIMAQLDISQLTLRVPVDAYGVALWKPPEREVFPPDCARCELVETCKKLPTSTGVALLWRRLGLIDETGAPTLRGQIVSFFSQNHGLAIAAALEDESYPLEELIYDLANLDAGFRFCGQDNRWAGRLAAVCRARFGMQTIPGYLENGMPPDYGAGAEQIVAAVHRDPTSKHAWVSDLVGLGDIDRLIIEWRSLLRQIS
ncbi:MAG: DEAD/DEAH box helicase, partial [Verrucomicrobiae bacterium]|nr:DEAD/DEAH box helicase [Verrucomicrobiae bacterium]MDW7980669.1 DEAD/DEAH box helicase [Verrucomicrobiales bacterium]